MERQDFASSKLCSACSEIELLPQKLAIPEPGSNKSQRLTTNDRYHPFAARFQLGTLAALYEKITTCDLCSLVTKILDVEFAPDYLETLRIAGGGDEYWCELVESVLGTLLSTLSATRNSCNLYDMNIHIMGPKTRSEFQNYDEAAVFHALQPCFNSTHNAVDRNVSAEISEYYYGRQRPPLVDPIMLRFWLEKCIQSHSVCQHSIREVLPFNCRMIDVERLCIIDNQDTGSLHFAALSYVWGSKSQKLTLNRENQSHLIKTSDSSILINTFSLDDVPKTVADAVRLTRMLRIKHLWVDTLCIVQDNEDDIRSQVNVMHRIYGDATVTIIASFGESSEAGLPGVCFPREAQQDVVVLRQGALMKTCLRTPRTSWGRKERQERNNYLFQSKWNSRGWTFQEALLSRRCLILDEQQVFWECCSASWCEERTLETSTDYRFRWPQIRVPFLSISATSKTEKVLRGDEFDYQLYTELVSMYSQRTLTFARDAERAFSGILKTLGRTSKMRYVQGIPERELSRYLCWHGSLSCRPESPFASWSWLAWTGPNINVSIDENAEPLLHVYAIIGDRLSCLHRTPNSSILDSHKLDLSPDEKATLSRLNLRDQHHLLFHAQTAHLQVSDDGRTLSLVSPNTLVEAQSQSRTAGVLNEIRADNGDLRSALRRGSLGALHEIDPKYNGVREFICVEREIRTKVKGAPPVFHLLMISTSEEGISYRQATGLFSQAAWQTARPTTKLIILG